MQDIIDMELEEYIPLKIIFNKDEEAVEYISYSKDKTSSLEFTVGIKSKLCVCDMSVSELNHLKKELELQ